MTAPETGTLQVDLGAITANFAETVRVAAPAEAGAVVKADAYGLGLEPVARALHGAGCRTFFVAQPGEGAALRAVLPDAVIYVLNGLMPDAAGAYADHELRPCLGSVAEIEEWAAAATPLPAALHVNTGINRLGLSAADVDALRSEPELLSGIKVTLVMSHLACADMPDNPMNARQRDTFERLRRLLPDAPASLANTGGLFLGADFCLNLVRPGIGLYGGSPFADGRNPFKPVATLTVPVLQVRTVEPGEAVGYGATFQPTTARRIAVVAAGYADGYFRALGSPDGSGGMAHVAGYNVPVVGRISMDMITLDVSDVPEDRIGRGSPVELFGKHVTLDEVAKAAGTIGYEILTGLGYRYRRQYKG